jgi:hypothetical protein
METFDLVNPHLSILCSPVSKAQSKGGKVFDHDTEATPGFGFPCFGVGKLNSDNHYQRHDHDRR